jgi:geranylgeranyl pyrophosphate synthase
MPDHLADPEAAPLLSEWLASHFTAWFEAAVDEVRTPGIRELWEQAMLHPAVAFLDRPGKHFRARLVTGAWTLVGPRPAEAMPTVLPVIVEALHAGSLIVDDVQDGAEQRRGGPALHHLVGTPLAINTGNLLYCWALDLLSTVTLGPDRELDLYRRTIRTMLRCHQGQALDVSVRICDTPQPLVREVVSASTDLKTGTLMELASALGAVAAGGSDRQVAALARFGRALGNGLQMLDDLSGVLNPRRVQEARTELRLARPTWTWAWLAGDLDEASFDALQQAGRAVAAGRDPSDLICRMATHLDLTGRQRVHHHLEQALEGLERDLGSSPPLTDLRREVDRLQGAYA